MFGDKRRQEKLRDSEKRQSQERFRRNERDGADIYRRIAALKKLDRARLSKEVMLLFKDAKHQTGVIRQSIADRTHNDFDAGDPAEGDLATFLAEGIATVMRENVTNPQTVFQALSEQFPEVHFTVDWNDAVSLVSAMIREQRIDGIMEGLEIAGLIEDKGKQAFGV
jgi:hypothetical protein